MRTDESAGVQDIGEQRIQAADRLLNAVSSMWRTHGRAQMSARQVAQAAGAQASQINYYFGGFEQLLCSAQAQSLTQAAQWCERTLNGIGHFDAAAQGGDAHDGNALGHLLAAIIDDWCQGQADLAFAWAECQILAARQGEYADANRQWRALWRRFWDAACGQMGVPELSDLMRVFFNGESFLHRIAWRAPFDRACLSETCLSWTRLLIAADAGRGPLRDHAREVTGGFAAPVLVEGSVQARAAEAAARVVGHDGPAAVTHRAVAQAAGLNLGAVTYHFPSGSTLMAAAWAHIYLRLTRPAETVDAGPLTRETFTHDVTAYSSESAQKPDVLAMEALLSQAARDERLRDMGAMIRYTRGQSTYLSLERLPRDAGPLTPQAASLVSSFIQGLGRDVAPLDLPLRQIEARRLLTQLLTTIGL